MWMCLIQTIEELNRTKRLSKKELFLSHLKSWGTVLSSLQNTLKQQLLGLQPASSCNGIYTISPLLAGLWTQNGTSHQCSWISKIAEYISLDMSVSIIP